MIVLTTAVVVVVVLDDRAALLLVFPARRARRVRARRRVVDLGRRTIGGPALEVPLGRHHQLVGGVILVITLVPAIDRELALALVGGGLLPRLGAAPRRVLVRPRSDDVSLCR